MTVVVVEYADLCSDSAAFPVQTAFGTDGLGIVCIRGIPGYEEARARLLPQARTFAHLEDNIKEKYEHPPSCYQFGWSCGKEKLQGRPDYSKGSYYNNPLYDSITDDPKIIEQFCSFASPNIWPSPEEVPDFEVAFKELGRLIVSVGSLVAKHCDMYISSKLPTYVPGTLQRIVQESKCCKARLLHYYSTSDTPSATQHPTATTVTNSSSGNINTVNSSSGVNVNSSTDDDLFSNWCGWHNDHGMLTGLTSALLLHEHNGDAVVDTQYVDPEAGLYIRNRRGELVKVSIPTDCLAFQIGETAQILSGGLLQATPHAVRASKVANVSRETFAVFMEPMWDYPMAVPTGIDPVLAQSQQAALSLPKGVPPLATRWQCTQTFGEFTDSTLSAYH